VKVVRSPQEAEQVVKQMIGMTLVTHQTGPDGKKVGRVLIEEGLQIERELYLSIVLDRAAAAPVIIASAAGGMDIEEVAASDPDKILREHINPGTGVIAFQARKLAFGMALPAPVAGKFVKVLEVSFDDNALYRHPELKDLRDVTEEDPLEVEASTFSLNYIRLDGNIGCMVNGAGLAMATMDIIKLAGGEPANFLDVGGGANAEQIKNAFRILMADKNVKAVLINIFGGILRCDVLAQGVVAAVTELGVPVPIVIRMEGTNVEEGKQILRDSKLNFTTADSMGEAAEKVVALARR
jgi:succinyl-CoA synthetase beta subunit